MPTVGHCNHTQSGTSCGLSNRQKCESLCACFSNAFHSDEFKVLKTVKQIKQMTKGVIDDEEEKVERKLKVPELPERRIYQEVLSRETYEDAFKLLGETRAIRNEQVQLVQQWLTENPNINAQNDPFIIICFLRGCKFDVDKAKQKIKCFYKMRAERPEWFSQRDPNLCEVDEILRLGCFLPLLEKDEENRLVVIIRTAAHNPRQHSQNNVFKVCKMILDLVLKTDESVSIYGVSAIFDMHKVQLGHALQLTPPLIKRSVQSWENYSCRPKRLEFCNSPIHVNVVLNIFRSFMSAKMKQRLSINKGPPVQHSIPRHCLPEDLGGSGPSYRELTEHWHRKALENREWFLEMERYKTIS